MRYRINVSPRKARSRGIYIALIGVTLVMVSIFGTGAATADWVVMNDGSRVQTEGSWKEQGSQLVFHIPGGTLASVRLSDVDLDASRRLTAAAVQAADERTMPKPEAPRKKATFVITDADVRHVNQAYVEAEADADDEGVADVPGGGEVAVASWNSSDLPDQKGLRIVGSVRNSSQNVAAGLNIAILAYDSTDELLLSVPATLGSGALAPGQTTSMAGELVGVFDYARVDFVVDYFPLENSSEAAPATSTQRPDEGR